MLTENDPPPYDGPFNSWLLQYAQGQVGVHADKVQEHQRQVSFHERQLRYWEQMTQALLASQGSMALPPTYSSQSSPRLDSKQPTRPRSALPSSFQNPFGEPEQHADAEQQLPPPPAEEDEEKRNANENADQQVSPEFPPEEPEMDPLVLEAESAAQEAEVAMREAAEAEALAAQAREEADRANAEAEAAREAEEEELRREEARLHEEEEAKRQAQREAEAAEREAFEKQQALQTPEPSPPPAVVVAPVQPVPVHTAIPPRKPPSTSPGLHADAAAVAASTPLKERMARIGGLNPLAMMPGGGMPRPKRPVDESARKPEESVEQQKVAVADPEPHAMPAELPHTSTQEIKPIPEPAKPAQSTSPVVKGPAPPPRKPATGGPQGATANPQAKPAADPHPPAAKVGDPRPPAKAAALPSAEPVKPAVANTTAAASTTANKKYCKANFDLENPPKGCPKFKKGDFAECVEVKGEWSHVIFLKNNEEGHVPTAYFSMDVTLPATPAAAAPVVAKKMKALFPFAPPKPKGFVPLKVGEIVTLEKGEPGEEWWVVKNASGLSGYVPHNYVKLI